MKFRKKPVVIEAVRVRQALDDAAHSWKDLPVWLREAYDRGDVLFALNTVHIRTTEGLMRGDAGDWIIRGIKGELYPCKPDVFDVTYDPEPETVATSQ